ncbi:MAG: hypothetical protein D6820_06560, partial [Lentisphaerae bacterium]
MVSGKLREVIVPRVQSMQRIRAIIRNQMMIRFLNAIGALMLACGPYFLEKGQAQTVIQIDTRAVIKGTLPRGAASVNLCWLLDSDRHRPRPISMRQALKELGVGSLRFPYGHLADNYLWHTPPFNDAAKGLRPRIACSGQAPAKWSWAVNPDGSFNKAMDFDEYMALCAELDATPLVVVNILSCRYKGGPAFSELKRSAVEWVKYARQRGYRVTFWQIGNEVDHHYDLLSREDYVRYYLEMAAGMKAVDPSIRVGPGILSKTGYFEAIVNHNPALIDFVSCHQYMFKYQKQCSSYRSWKESKERFIENVIRMQQAVTRSNKPHLPILVTETGISPANDVLGRINNAFKALWWFEVLMNELSVANVLYVYNWGTHSPWSGPADRENNDAAVLLRLDTNERKPTAEVIRLVNTFLLKRLLKVSIMKGYVRAYATDDHLSNHLNLFLLNKNDATEEVTILFRHD